MAGLLKEITDLPSLAKADVQVSNYLHIKRGVVDYKVTLSDVFSYHTELTNNPHSVTKTQVGLSNVVNSKQLVQANNLSDLTNIPAARTILDVDTKAEVTAKVAAHTSLVNNPHNVTKTQVGLGAVNNYPITDSFTDNSSVKYASAKACRGLYDLINTNIPTGLISLWHGATNAIPAGWALCNGGNGTPDLRDRFVVGAGSSYAVGTQGGATSVSHTHGVTVLGHALSIGEMPSHNHSGFGEAYTNWPYGNTGGQNHMGSNGGIDYDNFLYNTTSTGGNQAHSHGANVSTVTTDNRPPFYALAYIMKL